MAKSVRSKWKRKMKAIKRVRYAAKELNQLKSCLKNMPGKKVDLFEICSTKMPDTSSKNETTVKNESTATEKPQTEAMTKTPTNGDENQNPQNEAMEVDRKLLYHPFKLTNEHGNYPVWMNQRAIKKHKTRLRKLGHVQKKQKKNKKMT